MTDSADSSPVLSERRDRVLVITINRPEVRNAINAAVAEGIGGALDELDGDGELAAGVLTGAGGYFCAGMDLGAFVKGEVPYVAERGFAGITQKASSKPLIAAVEGFAVAGGFEIALSCDLIVAASGAKFGIPEVKRSLVAASKRIIEQQYDWSLEEMWVEQGEIAGPVQMSEDAREGATAFKEKRDPVWKGR